MSNISELIEQYLKSLLASSPEGYIYIQRNELAERFNCVPSQINYVLATRFTIQQGFIVESRRGGGGYVRIAKVRLPARSDAIQEALRFIGSEISQQAAEGLIERLREEGWLAAREAELIRSLIRREVLAIELPARDRLRANILKAVLASLLRLGPVRNGASEGS